MQQRWEEWNGKIEWNMGRKKTKIRDEWRNRKNRAKHGWRKKKGMKGRMEGMTGWRKKGAIKNKSGIETKIKPGTNYGRGKDPK